tara:strand:+ start:904 stop:1140 length:237 start_codon:yes stop_codon:yes gene_type:complete
MKVDYDVVNYKKFYWYDTQAYKFSGDDNRGYIYGYVEWYGNQRLDDACENYCDEIKWSWFKTEEERDKEFNKWNKGEA